MRVRMEKSWEEQNYRAFDQSGSAEVKQIEGRGARTEWQSWTPSGQTEESLGAKEESTEMAGRADEKQRRDARKRGGPEKAILRAASGVWVRPEGKRGAQQLQ